jgi:hypothetical protein
MSTLPIFASSGHPSPGADSAVSLAYCAGLQTPSPFACDGLIVTPSGKVTSTFFACPSEIASLSSSPRFGIFRLK